MYDSPINIIYNKVEESFENEILKAVQKAGITVDKEELIKALQYDRDQYIKGYEDGISEKTRGEWKLISAKDLTFYCSNCGRVQITNMDNFCSRCGADMRGEK